MPTGGENTILSGRIVATTASDVNGTAVVQGQGSATCINISSIYAYAMTAMSNQVIQFGATSTGQGILKRNFATKGDELNVSFPVGYVLGTDTALYINLATSGSVAVTVNHEVQI